jgi:ABC-2 type transport system permease protein
VLPEIARPVSPEDEWRAFWKMRRRTTAATLGQTVRSSRLRVTLVVFLSVLFWIGLFFLFSEGFRFLNNTINDAGMHLKTVQAIYNVFFASLMMMLVLSSGIILYSGLYCSEEAAFLLTTPARPERIVLHKFQEALVFSSWGFLLLGSPMLIAYGVAANAPWYYFALLGPFMLAFIYIPGAIGLILCLLLVWRMPRIRMYAVAGGMVLLVAALTLIWWSFFWGADTNLLTPTWFRKMLDRLSFSEHRLLPSWWLSSGLLEATRRTKSLEQQPWTQSIMFLALLVSNALFFHVLTVWTAGRFYRKSYAQLQAAGTTHRGVRGLWFDRWISDRLPILSRPVRLLIVKDLRIFRRDPVQWSQFLIFFGLLALYFVNIRKFSYDYNYALWVNMISFLNLAVVGLILSTFTTRFIFPMISLEGRRFWILGLLPVKRESILWGKFLFAAAGSGLPCTMLIFLSDFMLQISTLVLMLHQVICVLLCLGLSGIAVGLGAKMPNLREQSPSKIAAGFGGTLNLVLSAMYIVAVVLLTAVPCHFYLHARENDLQIRWLELWLVLGTAAAVLLGIIATLVPMWLGLKAFRQMEF